MVVRVCAQLIQQGLLKAWESESKLDIVMVEKAKKMLLERYHSTTIFSLNNNVYVSEASLKAKIATKLWMKLESLYMLKNPS